MISVADPDLVGSVPFLVRIRILALIYGSVSIFLVGAKVMLFCFLVQEDTFWNIFSKISEKVG
jgi:hypothetical protein